MIDYRTLLSLSSACKLGMGDLLFAVRFRYLSQPSPLATFADFYKSADPRQAAG